ncbi:MAG: hypothetical protein WC732_05425 [Candidatus Omnitrophota bacterium]
MSERENSPQTANTVVFKVPGPEMVFPMGETVEIRKDDKEVVFRWNPGKTPYTIHAFLFRIYKGQSMIRKNQVYDEQVSGFHQQAEVSPDIFEDGETYTWFVKQINMAGGQLMFSDPAFHTFEVKKKAAPRVS